MMTGTYDNTHDIPIYVDNVLTLNIMPTHFYDKAYYLHHLLKEPTAAQTIHTGNGPVKNTFLDRHIAQCTGVYDSVQTTRL